MKKVLKMLMQRLDCDLQRDGAGFLPVLQELSAEQEKWNGMLKCCWTTRNRITHDKVNRSTSAVVGKVGDSSDLVHFSEASVKTAAFFYDTSPIIHGSSVSDTITYSFSQSKSTDPSAKTELVPSCLCIQWFKASALLDPSYIFHLNPRGKITPRRCWRSG